jgi:hypothetical protein
MVERKRFDALLAAAEAGMIDAIIARHRDRLAINTAIAQRESDIRSERVKAAVGRNVKPRQENRWRIAAVRLQDHPL